MAKPLVTALDRDGIPPRSISAKLRSQLHYFTAAPGSPGVPALAENEFWFDPGEVTRWLDDGVFHLVSPLDTANTTELELTEEQEDFLGWLKSNEVHHVRVEG